MKKATLLAALALVSASVSWAGDKLEIIKAEYGAKDKWTDITASVQAKVTDHGLTIEANNNLCQDPAPGLPKILKITAKAGDKQAEFLCSERKSIEISAEKVIATAKNQSNGLVIVSAVYGSGDKTVDVTAKIKELIGEGTKKITASNSIFGDPAEGEGKTLTIKYKLNGKDAAASANENESLDLP